MVPKEGENYYIFTSISQKTANLLKNCKMYLKSIYYFDRMMNKR